MLFEKWNYTNQWYKGILQVEETMHEKRNAPDADLIARLVPCLREVNLAAETVDSPSLKEERLGFPSCGDTMRPEGGSRSEGITSSSVWGIEIDMCMLLGYRFCCLYFDCEPA